MKKKIITTLSLSILIGASLVVPRNVDVKSVNGASTYAMSYALTGGGEIGYTINLAKDAYDDFENIKTQPIFASTWLSNLEKVCTGLNTATTDINTATSIEEMAELISQDVNLNPSISSDSSLFLGTAASKFSNTDYMNYSEHIYQYYSNFSFTMNGYTYELPNFYSDIETYRKKLNMTYRNGLTALFNGTTTSEEFFETFGTHAIVKAAYGGKFEINYSLVSERYDLWGKLNTPITNYLNSAIYSKVGHNTTISFDMINEFNFWPTRELETLEITNRGGFGVSNMQLNGLFNALNVWRNNVYMDPVIVSFTSDGLIPLWDLLPSTLNTTSNRNLLIQKYNEYINGIHEEINTTYYPELLTYDEVGTGYKVARPGDVEVTDDGYYANDYDVIDLNEFFDVKYDYMKAHGYTKIGVCVSMSLKEINMGHQLIAFFATENEDDSYMIDYFDFELDGALLETEFHSYTFIRLNLPIDIFDYSDPDDHAKLVFRYSADGALEDNWVNTWIEVQIVYEK